MHAVPENPDAKAKRNEKSRLVEMQDAGKDVQMPPFEGPIHLLEYFWEIGPTFANGMGAGPLPQSEIAAWQSNTGIELSAWESRTIRRLSVEYLVEQQRATKRTAFPPWSAPISVAEKMQVAEEMRQANRNIIKG